MTGSVGSSYIGSVRFSNAITASAPSLKDWVEKCLPSSSFTNSNLVASFVLPIVNTWSSNPTVGDQYSVALGAGADSVAAGRIARRC